MGNAWINLLDIAHGRKYSDRGGGVVLPSAVSNLPLPLSTLISFYLIFCFLIFGAFKNIGRVEVGNSWNSVSPPPPLSVIKW